MSDVVVTCPKWFWEEWIEEGDLPGEPWSGTDWSFYLGGRAPRIEPGERVYVVAHGKLRGYSPLTRIDITASGHALIRRSHAVAVTIPPPIPGFRGFRYRWWERAAEAPFPEWRTP